jgi:hypothetical protein
MKKHLKYSLLLFTLLCFSCEGEEVPPKTDLENLTEEINSIIGADSIKEVEVYDNADIVLEGSKYGFEVRNQYLYASSQGGIVYYFDLNKLIFYEIRKGDSTLVLSF